MSAPTDYARPLTGAERAKNEAQRYLSARVDELAAARTAAAAAQARVEENELLVKAAAAGLQLLTPTVKVVTSDVEPLSEDVFAEHPDDLSDDRYRSKP
jgi:hypothetical protein